MKYALLFILFLQVLFAKAQTNNFPLYSNGAFSGGTGDYTNTVSPHLKLQASSEYVRVIHLGTNSSVSAVYNYQTGKNAFWGEPTDAGQYIFRGRDMILQEGKLGIGISSPTAKLDINQSGGSSGQLSAMRIRSGNTATYFGNNQILFSHDGGTGYTHSIKTRHQSGSINNNAIDFYLWQPGDAVDAVGSNFAMTLNGGNVGVGTQYPITKLDLVNPTTESGIKSTATLNGNSSFYLAAYTPTYGPVPSYANKTVLQTYDNAIAFSAYGSGANNEIQFYTGGRTEPFKRMVLDVNGNVGIGTSSPNQKLTVNGTIYGKEVKVDLSVPGPDYVFEKEYVLPSLESIQTYIDQNKHLPEVPSAEEMETNGINLSEMNMLLLKKVEELTLYLIRQQETIDNQNKRIEILEQVKK